MKPIEETHPSITEFQGYKPTCVSIQDVQKYTRDVQEIKDVLERMFSTFIVHSTPKIGSLRRYLYRELRLDEVDDENY